MITLIEERGLGAMRSSSMANRGGAGMPTEMAIGVRVVTGTKRGEVRFIGDAQFSSGEWVGVALDTPDGKNDGSVGGVSYFQCEPLHGLFVKKAQAKVDREFYVAADDGKDKLASLRERRSTRLTAKEAPATAIPAASKVPSAAPMPVIAPVSSPVPTPEAGPVVILAAATAAPMPQESSIASDEIDTHINSPFKYALTVPPPVPSRELGEQQQQQQQCAEIDTLRGKVAALEAQLRQTEASAAAAAVKADRELSERLAAARGTHESSEQELRAQIAEAQQVKQDSIPSAVAVEANGLKRIADLESQILELSDTVESLTLDKEQLSIDLELKDEALRDLALHGGEKEASALSRENIRLREALRKLNEISLAEREEAAAQALQLRSRGVIVEEGTKELEVLRAFKLAAEKDICDMKQTIDEHASYESMMEEMTERCQQLQLQVQQQQELAADLRAEVEVGEQLDQSQRQELQALSRLVASLEAESDQLQGDRRALAGRLEEATAAVERYKRLVASQREELQGGAAAASSRDSQSSGTATGSDPSAAAAREMALLKMTCSSERAEAERLLRELEVARSRCSQLESYRVRVDAIFSSVEIYSTELQRLQREDACCGTAGRAISALDTVLQRLGGSSTAQHTLLGLAAVQAACTLACASLDAVASGDTHLLATDAAAALEATLSVPADSLNIASICSAEEAARKTLPLDSSLSTEWTGSQMPCPCSRAAVHMSFLLRALSFVATPCPQDDADIAAVRKSVEVELSSLARLPLADRTQTGNLESLTSARNALSRAMLHLQRQPSSLSALRAALAEVRAGLSELRQRPDMLSSSDSAGPRRLGVFAVDSCSLWQLLSQGDVRWDGDASLAWQKRVVVAREGVSKWGRAVEEAAALKEQLCGASSQLLQRSRELKASMSKIEEMTQLMALMDYSATKGSSETSSIGGASSGGSGGDSAEVRMLTEALAVLEAKFARTEKENRALKSDIGGAMQRQSDLGTPSAAVVLLQQRQLLALERSCLQWRELASSRIGESLPPSLPLAALLSARKSSERRMGAQRVYEEARRARADARVVDLTALIISEDRVSGALQHRIHGTADAAGTTAKDCWELLGCRASALYLM